VNPATVIACRVDELPPGSMHRVPVEGRPAIAVYNIDGQVYATADRCTHATASLTDGELDGDCVACPVHFGMFHVPTGKALCFPVKEDLVTYPVEVVDGEVRVLLHTRAEVTA
jgi:ethylbenzene dioxygenase ferredoxin subunit